MCVVDEDECICIGHTVPGVEHIVACCDQPHIDDFYDPEEP